ncbi:MAG: outer membrane beta-barrel protein [Bacteroidetes bacterium]|nr:outer membrane beta-barrel protein [Bacteroidota bacterium]MDA1122396.1 outer membrane beta-barrel protein [Bacteroidota bacterium]
MKKIFFTLLIATMALGFSVNAQEEEEEAAGVSISGTVDTYYRATLDRGTQAPGSSFANGSGFSMGMVNLIGSYEGKKAGVVADLVFGPRGIDAAFGAPYGGSLVNQMYAYWNVSDAVTLTFGQWNTFLGYEVISPAANFNYSTSYMFSWGPFNQSGLKANFALSDNWSMMLAVMNPTDLLETNIQSDGKFKKYTAGFQLGYSTDAGSIYLNSRYGDYSGDLFQIDLTGGFDISDSFYFGFNATMLDDGDAGGFSGAAIYQKISLSDAFSLGARAEYFMIKDGYLGVIGLDPDGDGNVIDLTLSANYSVGNLTIIPEFRIDMASEDSWIEGDGSASSPTATSSLSSFLLAAVYSF